METWWVRPAMSVNAKEGDPVGSGWVKVVKLPDVEALERRVSQAGALIRGLLSNPMMHLPVLDHNREALEQWLAAEPTKE